MVPGPLFSSSRSEKRWVNHITRNYTIDLCIPPCVFQVPQSLRDAKRQAYTPQAVGLGPYHHLRPEVQEMESKKRDAVKTYLSVTDIQKFIQFVNEVPLKVEPKNGRKFQSTILSFYDRYLDLDSKTLVWIVVIDGIFLLHFLSQESKWKDQRLVADIMMLENQIPLNLMTDIGTALRDSFPDAVDIKLLDEFYRFCDQQSPLKLSNHPPLIDAAFQKHMLHFLYDLIVKNNKHEKGGAQKGSEQVPPSCLPNLGDLCRAICKFGKAAMNMVKDFISGIEQLQTQGLRIPGNIGNVSKLVHQLEKTSDLYDNGDKRHQHRLTDKIDVPPVSQLHQIAKIKFVRRDGGIGNILFDESMNILYLPEITLGETSEVVLRNLVAYEAASAEPGSILELAEYVDLMCGIIDTEIDVKLLKNFEIIKGNLPDEEIVRIFNGINKSIQRPNKESIVQDTVEKLNRKFSNLRVVKAYKFIDKSSAALQSWIRRLFPILVLMLLALQSFCEIYGCSSRRLGYAAAPAASSSSLDSEAKLMVPRKLLGYDH